jgi:hypothetical protein
MEMLRIGSGYKFWMAQGSSPITGVVTRVFAGWLEIDAGSEFIYVNLLHVESITVQKRM